MTLMLAAPERALPTLVRGADLAVEARQHRVESWARTIVFWCHMGAGNLDAAGRAADALVASARANDEPEGQAFGRTSQGRLCVVRGDLSAARQLFAEAAALSRDKDAFWSRADALTCLCSTTLALGDVSASRQILEEALVFLVPLRMDGAAFLFGPLAKLLADAGERDRAVQVLSVVPRTFDDIGALTLIRADPTGSLTRATREVLAALGASSTTAADPNPDLDAALHAALDR
jgi:hypothetical protein